MSDILNLWSPVKQLEPSEECDLVIHGMCRGKKDSQKSTGGKKD